ncbi:META domain-containing protein [Streptomyces flavochromogenes]|uniref:META domain-containing protein n=1 Tax=Streptomyces flavochromogenes TaxID=68199 RepID=UPI0004C0DBBE|nr:META domain-containing protein [Streptomyces flavochromogenes]
MQTQTQRTLASAASAAALALLLAACGTEGGSTGAGSGSDTVSPDLPVAGTHWTIGAVTVDGRRSAAPDGARVEFGADGRARGNSGCNTFGATVAVKGDTLTVSPQEITEMGCPEDRQRFETELVKAFTGPLKGKQEGEALTLTSPDGRNGLELTAEADLPLRGTTWKIDGLISGDTASSLPAGSGDKARLVLGADGRVSGNLGCNNFAATARVEGKTLTVEGPAATTRMMCTGPQMQLETKLYELLDGRLTYRLDHRTLTLTNAEGEGLGATADTATTGGTSEGAGGTGGQEPSASR